MITPLRLGFLFSGLLHVAVVAAFSLSPQTEIPAVDEPRPLTLKLALFKPAQTAPAPPAPLEERSPEPQALAEPPPVSEPQLEKPLPVEPQPTPLVKSLEPKHVEPPKPRPPAKRVRKVEPVSNKRIKTRPKKPRKIEAKPLEANPIPPNPPIKLAAVAKPQPPTPAMDVQEKQHYLAALAAKINRSKYYPSGSRRRGEEGTVVVRFVVQKDGALTELNIVESSGSRRLDAAALKTLRRVSPFRPIPDVLGRDHWSISVPIAFSLRG